MLSAEAMTVSIVPSGSMLIDHAQLFLSGRSQDIQQNLAAEMERAAEALDFETAAMLRDCGLRTHWDLDHPVASVDLILGSQRPGWVTP